MDDRERIIDDWLSGEEIDPCDYDAYQIEELKRALGYDDEGEDDSVAMPSDYGDAESGDEEEDSYYNDYYEEDD